MQQGARLLGPQDRLARLTASVTSVACAGLSQMLVTKTSAKAVMAFRMALIRAGVLWASRFHYPRPPTTAMARRRPSWAGSARPFGSVD